MLESFGEVFVGGDKNLFLEGNALFVESFDKVFLAGVAVAVLLGGGEGDVVELFARLEGVAADGVVTAGALLMLRLLL